MAKYNGSQLIPANLAQAASMGHIGEVGHPDVQAKIDDALTRIVSAGRHAGTLAFAGNVEKYAAMGVRFFYTDTGPWIAAGARDFMAKAQRAIG